MRPLIAAVSVALVFASAAVARADNYLTQSGLVLCAVTSDAGMVICQGDFAQAPTGDNGVVTTGDGELRWAQGNLPVDDPTTNMTYGSTYQRGGWTIHHDSSGTRFTLDRTGHGMFVSVGNVYAF